MKNKSLAFVSCYYFPNYVRMVSLLNSLHLIKGLKIYKVINKENYFFKYLEVFLKTIWIRIKHNPDIYFINFRGYIIFLLLYPFIKNKKVIFDEFVSAYDSLINERRVLKENSVWAKFIFGVEKWILNSADLVLTDTKSNKNYYSKLFGVDKNKFKAIYLGTDEDLFRPEKIKRENKKFKVFFYGSVLPLHGIDLIYEAAKRLKDNGNIEFTFVAKNKNNVLDKIIKLKNVKYIEWVDYQKLPKLIAKMDLCLGGPFGKTGQASRVITGKTYQFWAMGKPTIIGKNKETDQFKDKENCLLVRLERDEDLAEKILWAYENKNKLKIIGINGNKLYGRVCNQNKNTKILERYLDI